MAGHGCDGAPLRTERGVASGQAAGSVPQLKRTWLHTHRVGRYCSCGFLKRNPLVMLSGP
jgi:hypothetical protein